MLTPLQREHLRLIQSKEGRLDPREVLRDARNANSPLHDLFEWDDSAAADAYRMMRYYLANATKTDWSGSDLSGTLPSLSYSDSIS